MNLGKVCGGVARAAALCALISLTGVNLTGCGSSQGQPVSPPAPVGGGTAEAGSPAEEKVLERLADMPPSKAQRVGDLAVLAEAPYSAASGKTCRRVTLTKSAEPRTSRTRLACSDGGPWRYVPDVFLSPPNP
jgi:hypothetical protein